MTTDKLWLLGVMSLLAIALFSVIVYWSQKSIRTARDTIKDVLKREAWSLVGAINVLSILLFFFVIVTPSVQEFLIEFFRLAAGQAHTKEPETFRDVAFGLMFLFLMLGSLLVIAFLYHANEKDAPGRRGPRRPRRSSRP